MNAKIQFWLMISLWSAANSPAQTNGPVIPVLSAAGQSYTNARIVQANPAYVVVQCDSGIVQLSLSNLPARYREKYGYSPEAAANFLAGEQQRQQRSRQAVQDQQVAYQRYLASLAGTNRAVQILEVTADTSHGGWPLCIAANMERGILVKNLPDAIRNFFSQEAALQATIDTLSRQVERDRFATNAAANTAPAMGLVYLNTPVTQPTPAQAAVTLQADQDRLTEVQETWTNLAAQAEVRTTIYAYPTGLSYGGYTLWNCTGMAASP